MSDIVFPHTTGFKDGNIHMTRLSNVTKIRREDDVITKKPYNQIHPAIWCLTKEGPRYIRFQDIETRDNAFAYLETHLHTDVYLTPFLMIGPKLRGKEAFDFLSAKPADLLWEASVVTRHARAETLDAFRCFSDISKIILQPHEYASLLYSKYASPVNALNYVVSLWAITLPVPKEISQIISPIDYFKFKCGNL
jgi:hypothetical protein